MTDFLTFAGVPVARVRLVMSYYGLWMATLALYDATTLPATTSPLVLGNLSLQGTVYRGASYTGQRKAMVVGGAGGWRQSVPAQQYAQTSGVLVSTVLGDAATLVGERVSVTSDSLLPGFVREAAPASRVLRQVAGIAWWMRADGVTVVGPRVSSTVSSAALVESYDTAAGKAIVSTEDYASWLPGASYQDETIAAPIVVSAVEFDSDAAGVARLTILAMGASDAA